VSAVFYSCSTAIVSAAALCLVSDHQHGICVCHNNMCYKWGDTCNPKHILDWTIECGNILQPYVACLHAGHLQQQDYHCMAAPNGRLCFLATFLMHLYMHIIMPHIAPVCLSWQHVGSGSALQSFRVINIGTSWKPICDFLLYFHCNHMPVGCFQDVTIYWL